ncbi:MAG: nucleotide 5'-monophosphate nucleosidase PpnN [Spongiibacteraceae bacterium]
MNKISHATVRPTSSLNLLSHNEIDGVMNYNDEVFKLFRQCALAVLNAGTEEDDADRLFSAYHDFDIRIIPQSRGIKLEVFNAPAQAFVNGKMIRGIQEHLFSALRDIVYIEHKFLSINDRANISSEDLTDMVFRVLRNAGVVKPGVAPNLVVCWGGHAIGRVEYDYTKLVGYELGLRGLNIATGCGIGAMKGPMKGAVVGHGKQKISDGRYIGITEPSIIAAESPNPTVSELVILPDIEKRLEAFVRLSHAIIVFPGGAGTVEEVLYLLAFLMHPDNKGLNIPVIFSAPTESSDYFTNLNRFISNTLGESATKFYQIIIGDPGKVAQQALLGVEKVRRHRSKQQESYAFNWQLKLPLALQTPFHPSHDSMYKLQLDLTQPKHILATELRRAFSGIVAGNIKAPCVAAVKKQGPYILQGEPRLMAEIDALLSSFVDQGRMKLKGGYVPCYRIDK